MVQSSLRVHLSMLFPPLCPRPVLISSSFSTRRGIKCDLSVIDRRPGSGAACMKSRVFGLGSLFVLMLGALPGSLAPVANAADQKIEVLKEAPQGLSADVAGAIAETGFRITGQDG